MLFKNQKVGVISDTDDCSELLNLDLETDSPIVCYVTKGFAYLKFGRTWHWLVRQCKNS